MSQAAFPAGTIIAEGTLYAEPKQFNKEGKTTTISLKVKCNYREQEGEELDAFFIDIIVTGSSADNILEANWGKYDRITFMGDFKGHRWTRKLEDGGTNEEQTISVFARQIGASPRFVGVDIEKQEFNNDKNDNPKSNSGGRSSRRNDDDDDAPAERSSRRSSRGNSSESDDAPAERSSRRSSRGSDSSDSDDAPAEERSGRSRSSRRARDTSYGDDD